MSNEVRYKAGTLIRDTGKIGVIYRIIESGTLNAPSAIMKWRFNYEIYYFDGAITIMSHGTIDRLIQNGTMEIIKPEEYSVLFKG